MPPPYSLSAALCALVLCLATACEARVPAEHEDARPELALMGTIPLYWGETDGFGELLSGESDAHWARARLEDDYRLRPLDSLDGASLEGVGYLLLAQPRALTPAENVALDAWVRRGGRLLLFADPLMTGESRYAIGDRRRPQDVILLSPILAHWGLELEFDEEQRDGPLLIRTSEVPLPVELTGSLALRSGEANCVHLGPKVLAECTIGRGRALILADAALLDLHQPDPAAPKAFDWLVGEAFARRGEIAGRGPDRRSRSE